MNTANQREEDRGPNKAKYVGSVGRGVDRGHLSKSGLARPELAFPSRRKRKSPPLSHLQSYQILSLLFCSLVDFTRDATKATDYPQADPGSTQVSRSLATNFTVASLDFPPSNLSINTAPRQQVKGPAQAAHGPWAGLGAQSPRTASGAVCTHHHKAPAREMQSASRRQCKVNTNRKAHCKRHF